MRYAAAKAQSARPQPYTISATIMHQGTSYAGTPYLFWQDEWQ